VRAVHRSAACNAPFAMMPLLSLMRKV
jgi:hypothetical protein